MAGFRMSEGLKMQTASGSRARMYVASAIDG
jgi:hypothetical protein